MAMGFMPLGLGAGFQPREGEAAVGFDPLAKTNPRLGFDAIMAASGGFNPSWLGGGGGGGLGGGRLPPGASFANKPGVGPSLAGRMPDRQDGPLGGSSDIWQSEFGSAINSLPGMSDAGQELGYWNMPQGKLSKGLHKQAMGMAFGPAGKTILWAGNKLVDRHNDKITEARVKEAWENGAMSLEDLAVYLATQEDEAGKTAAEKNEERMLAWAADVNERRWDDFFTPSWGGGRHGMDHPHAARFNQGMGHGDPFAGFNPFGSGSARTNFQRFLRKV